MSIKAILFDLDGTLLPMDQELFTKTYLKSLAISLTQYGYEPNSLIEAVWTGTIAMMKNNGNKTNEEMFWDTFTSILGKKTEEDISKFDKFYKEEFDKIQAVCGQNPESANLIKFLKERGYTLALATNPLFPTIATHKRTQWAGLNPSDFQLITTYENSRYCKPNLNYYLNITEKLSVDPTECLMVGNDVTEDMVASKIGMKVFLLTDHILNSENIDTTNIPQGSFSDLKNYILSL
ncbi:MAG: HAD family hydrolase [Clostridiales bacterium]|nr:HAD family hydrolase [Clostridiales bacterium]